MPQLCSNYREFTKWLLLATALASQAHAQGSPDVSLTISGLGAPFDNTVISSGFGLSLPFLTAKGFTLSAATTNGTFTNLTITLSHASICNTNVLAGNPSGLPDVSGVVTTPQCTTTSGMENELSVSNSSGVSTSGSGTLTVSTPESSQGPGCSSGELMESSVTATATGTLAGGQSITTKPITVTYIRILKVISWNIQYGYNNEYTYGAGVCPHPVGEYRLNVVEDTINTRRVHLALLQEVRRGWWDGPCCDDQPALLAAATGMQSAYGVTNDRSGDSIIFPDSLTCHCTPGCHRYVGSLTLSRFPILSSQMSAGSSCCDPNNEPRTLETLIHIGDRDLFVYNSHLEDGDTAERQALRRTQAVQTMDLLRGRVGFPQILGGDLNASWDEEPFLPIRAGLNDSVRLDRSLPFIAPDNSQVDFIMSNLNGASLRYSCKEPSGGEVSDHAPIVSWYQLEADPAPVQVADPATLIAKVRVTGNAAVCGSGSGPLRWFDETGGGTPRPISQNSGGTLQQLVDFTARFSSGLRPGSTFSLASDRTDNLAGEGSDLVTRTFQFFNGLNTQVGQIDVTISSTDRLLRNDGFPSADEYTRFSWNGTSVTSQQVCNSGVNCCSPISVQQACGNTCGHCASNGCLGSYNCTCAAGQTCFSGNCCTPLTRTQACAAGQCSSASNGCGGTVSCYSCGLHEFCGSGGFCQCSAPFHDCGNGCTTANCNNP